MSPMRFRFRAAFGLGRRSRPTRDYRFSGLEGLESRVTPAVSASLNGHVLGVTLDAAGDVATLSNHGAAVTVNGAAFVGVRKIDVLGNSMRNQTVNLDGHVSIGSHFTATAISTVNVTGTWQVGNFSVTLSKQVGAIKGGGALTAHGTATFLIPHDALADVDL